MDVVISLVRALLQLFQDEPVAAAPPPPPPPPAASSAGPPPTAPPPAPPIPTAPISETPVSAIRPTPAAASPASGTTFYQHFGFFQIVEYISILINFAGNISNICNVM